MGKKEVVDILEKKPRLCSREIAEELEENFAKVSHILGQMLDKEIIASEPTKEEMLRLLIKYPNIIYAGKDEHSINRIKVFELL